MSLLVDTWTWAVGDTDPLRKTLLDEDGNPVDLQGVTLQIVVSDLAGELADQTLAVDNLQVGDGSDGSKGQVSFDPTTGTPDITAAAARWIARIEATFAGGRVQHYPDDGYIQLVVSVNTAATLGAYVTREAFKDSKMMAGTSYADPDIDLALRAASQGLDSSYGTRPNTWSVQELDGVRYYTAESDWSVRLGDVLRISEVALDYGIGDHYGLGGGGVGDLANYGPGTYATLLQTTDYRVLPIEAGSVDPPVNGSGEPFRTLELARGAATVRRLPAGRDAIRITGDFGWSVVPPGVQAATMIIAGRLLRRSREAPFGIVQLGEDGAAIRAGQLARDPEVAFAMKPATRARSIFA